MVLPHIIVRNKEAICKEKLPIEKACFVPDAKRSSELLELTKSRYPEATIEEVSPQEIIEKAINQPHAPGSVCHFMDKMTSCKPVVLPQIDIYEDGRIDIYDGMHRLEAARMLGIEKVPVIVVKRE